MYDIQDYIPGLKYGADLDLSTLDISNLNTLDVAGTLTVDGASTLTGAVTMGSTLGVTGAVTLSSTLGVTGDATFTGATDGLKREVVSGTDAAVSVTAAQSGAVFFATASSGTQTYTLPAVAAGLWYTFICGHASGEILIDQAASEVITITTFAAVGADADTAIVAPAGGTGIKNTAATNAVGDSCTLVSDGTGWYGVGITSGIWASQ